jgi:hemerythrin superfamily protein
MKKLIFLISFLTISCFSFAQNFTQATLNEILEEYKKDSKAFFNNRLTADFRVINKEGAFQSRQDFIKSDPQKIVKTEILEPIILQSSDLAVVSGIHQTTRLGNDGRENTTQVACTYTWQRVNNKWMFAASQQNAIVKK